MLVITRNTDAKEMSDYPETLYEIYREDRECEVCGKKGAYVLQQSNQAVGLCKECLEEQNWVEEIQEVRQLRMICESCNAYFWIERDYKGKRIFCPYCGSEKDVNAD